MTNVIPFAPRRVQSVNPVTIDHVEIVGGIEAGTHQPIWLIDYVFGDDTRITMSIAGDIETARREARFVSEGTTPIREVPA